MSLDLRKDILDAVAYSQQSIRSEGRHDIVSKIVNRLEYELGYIEYDMLQRGDPDIDAFCAGFQYAIKCIKDGYNID